MLSNSYLETNEKCVHTCELFDSKTSVNSHAFDAPNPHNFAKACYVLLPSYDYWKNLISSLLGLHDICKHAINIQICTT